MMRLCCSDSKIRALWIDPFFIIEDSFKEIEITFDRMPKIFRLSTSYAIFADISAMESDGETLSLSSGSLKLRQEFRDQRWRGGRSDFINDHPVERLLIIPLRPYNMDLHLEAARYDITHRLLSFTASIKLA